MKPMRGLPNSWLTNMSKERRTALISLAVLVVLLVSLVLYQRFAMLSSEIPLPDPRQEIPVEQGTKVQAPAPAEGTDVSAASGATKGSLESIPAATRLSRPLSQGHKVLKSFGKIDTAMGDMRMYPGVAYLASPGESVLAAGPGTVSEVEEDPLDGRVLVIDHGNSLKTRYAGLGKLMVSEGTAVTPGTIIGQIGEPGPARTDMGPHLQFQVLVRGEPVDPVSYFPN